MSTWTKCSDALPPIGKPVIVAWDSDNAPLGVEMMFKAVYRELYPSACLSRGWVYVDDDNALCVWDDDQLPTHWMPWPEFKP